MFPFPREDFGGLTKRLSVLQNRKQSFRTLSRIWRVLTVYAALNNLRSYQFPYPLENQGELTEMIADFERLYYVSSPREDLGGSNQLGSNPKPRKNCCFRPLSRFRGVLTYHNSLLQESRRTVSVPSRGLEGLTLSVSAKITIRLCFRTLSRIVGG